MTQHQPAQADEFAGFMEAGRILCSHDARARVHCQLSETDFLGNEAVVAVHVDNTTRADRVFLIAFNKEGRQLASDTIYAEGPDDHLDVAPEFDHDSTHLGVAPGSTLAQAIARENGWVIDMAALRAYDPITDRRTTQRALFLAHLKDMTRTGRARQVLLGENASASDAA